MYETQRLIQSEKDILFLVGYGVTYIQPTYQSLLHLQDYGNDTGLEKQGQVKVCLIDQEAHREFCDENQLVVGTPVLQMYYNAKSIKFRFLNSYESQVQASDPSKRVNIYIGQLHFAMINSLVQMTFQAIQEAEHSNADDIVVDVQVARLNELVISRAFEERTEDIDLDSDTDSGEDTSDSGQ